MYLENDIIRLRPVEISDLDLLYKWENNSDIWLVSSTIVPFSKKVIKQYIDISDLDIFTNKQLRLMIVSKENSETIGAIDLFDFDFIHKRAGVGVLINDTNDRGKGYAKESLSLLIDYCFDILNLHQLFCNILVTNKNSIKLFENFGFEGCGTKKEWVRNINKWEDEIMYQLISKT